MARWPGNAGVHTGTAPRSGARRRTPQFHDGTCLGTYPTGRTGPRPAFGCLRGAPPGRLGTEMCTIPELHFHDRRGVQEDPIIRVSVGAPPSRGFHHGLSSRLRGQLEAAAPRVDRHGPEGEVTEGDFREPRLAEGSGQGAGIGKAQDGIP